LTYQEARSIEPGDVIRYVTKDGEREARVTGPIHDFPLERGLVVYVPIEGGTIVHGQILSAERA
jgi:hypothetical protein